MIKRNYYSVRAGKLDSDGKIDFEMFDKIGMQKISEPFSGNFFFFISQRLEPGVINLNKISVFVKRLVS